MPKPIRISAPFASVYDTASVLGVPEARAQEIDRLVDGFIARPETAKHVVKFKAAKKPLRLSDKSGVVIKHAPKSKGCIIAYKKKAR